MNLCSHLLVCVWTEKRTKRCFSSNFQGFSTCRTSPGHAVQIHRWPQAVRRRSKGKNNVLMYERNPVKGQINILDETPNALNYSRPKYLILIQLNR